MSHTVSESYLTIEVMTATPQKLQLILLDAAIREVERARHHWHAQENKQAGKYILRAQRIMSGLLGGLDYELKSDLISKVAGVYLFIYHALTRAFVDKNENKLSEALRVLAVERETWRQVCENLAVSTGGQTDHNGLDSFSPGQNRDIPLPLPTSLFSNDANLPDHPVGSFSLEA